MFTKRLRRSVSIVRAKGCPFETLWDYAPVTDDLRTCVLALICGTAWGAS